MQEPPQSSYESRLKQFLNMIHGQEGLVAKLSIFRELVRQHGIHGHGDELWKISPPLYFFTRAMQNEVLLALARLLEAKDRSWGNLEKFLNFSAANFRHIQWSEGPLPEAIVLEQKTALKSHSDAIESIMGRRDKVIAHLDRKYFFNPESVDEDFPLTDTAMIDLANEIIRILGAHERGLTPDRASFHLGEFYHIAVDNMVRTLAKHRMPKSEGVQNDAG